MEQLHAGSAPKGQSQAPSIRSKILDEIVSTERTFVENLKTLIDVYIQPLGVRGILTREEASALFSNWELLYPLNKTFLQDLEKAMAEPDCRVGKTFSMFAPYLKMYSHYLGTYDHAIAVLDELEKGNRKFSVFTEEAHKDPRCNRLDLASFLIMPVQRIPRYKMLLESLIKHTPVTHSDHKDLQDALALVSVVASHNNEHIRKQQNQLKMLSLANVCDFSHVPFKFSLLEPPSRRLIREGVMDVRRAAEGKVKRLNVWLFSDIIMLGRPQQDMFSSDKLLIKAVWDLDEVSISRGTSSSSSTADPPPPQSSTTPSTVPSSPRTPSQSPPRPGSLGTRGRSHSSGPSSSAPISSTTNGGAVEDAERAIVVSKPGADVWVVWGKDVTEADAWYMEMLAAIEEARRAPRKSTQRASSTASPQQSQTLTNSTSSGNLHGSTTAAETAAGSAVSTNAHESSWIASVMPFRSRSNSGVISPPLSAQSTPLPPQQQQDQPQVVAKQGEPQQKQQQQALIQQLQKRQQQQQQQQQQQPQQEQQPRQVSQPQQTSPPQQQPAPSPPPPPARRHSQNAVPCNAPPADVLTTPGTATATTKASTTINEGSSGLGGLFKLGLKSLATHNNTTSPPATDTASQMDLQRVRDVLNAADRGMRLRLGLLPRARALGALRPLHVQDRAKRLNEWMDMLVTMNEQQCEVGAGKRLSVDGEMMVAEAAGASASGGVLKNIEACLLRGELAMDCLVELLLVLGVTAPLSDHRVAIKDQTDIRTISAELTTLHGKLPLPARPQSMKPSPRGAPTTARPASTNTHKPPPDTPGRKSSTPSLAMRHSGVGDVEPPPPPKPPKPASNPPPPPTTSTKTPRAAHSAAYSRQSSHAKSGKAGGKYATAPPHLGAGTSGVSGNGVSGNGNPVPGSSVLAAVLGLPHPTHGFASPLPPPPPPPTAAGMTTTQRQSVKLRGGAGGAGVGAGLVESNRKSIGSHAGSLAHGSGSQHPLQRQQSKPRAGGTSGSRVTSVPSPARDHITSGGGGGIGGGGVRLSLSQSRSSMHGERKTPRGVVERTPSTSSVSSTGVKRKPGTGGGGGPRPKTPGAAAKAGKAKR